MNDDKNTNSELVLDLDRLPDTVIVTYMKHGSREVTTVGTLRTQLVGKPGRGNRKARTEEERVAAKSGALLKALFKAIDTESESEIKKYMAQCELLMGPAWLRGKLVERVSLKEAKQTSAGGGGTRAKIRA